MQKLYDFYPFGIDIKVERLTVNVTHLFNFLIWYVTPLYDYYHSKDTKQPCFLENIFIANIYIYISLSYLSESFLDWH